MEYMNKYMVVRGRMKRCMVMRAMGKKYMAGMVMK